MNSHIDNLIRDLAKAHGHSDLSPAELKDVRQKIAAAFIDEVLDASPKKPVDKKQPKKAPITSGSRDLSN